MTGAPELYRRTWAITLSVEWVMPCKEGNGTNEAHLPRRERQAENGARNARCQGCRGATRKTAKHARRRLRQALLSPGMGLRAHACAWSWTRREVGEDAVGQWGPRKHPTPTETRQGRSTAGCGQALVRAGHREGPRESSLPLWAKGEESDLAVLLCGAGRRNHLGYAGASRPERRSTRPGDVLPRKGKKVQGVHGTSTGADGRG